MSKVVLGIAGEMLAGKSTAASFLVQRYGAKQLRFSGLLDQLLEVLNLEKSRENEGALGQALRATFGEDALAHALAHAAKDSTDKLVIVDGFRKEGEVQALKEIPNFKLIFLKASLEQRFDRGQQRHEKADDLKLNLEEFKQAQGRPSDKDVPGLEKHADFIIENNGTLENFQQKLSEVIEKIQQQ